MARKSFGTVLTSRNARLVVDLDRTTGIHSSHVRHEAGVLNTWESGRVELQGPGNFI